MLSFTMKMDKANPFIKGLLFLAAIIVLTFVLTGVSSGFTSLQGWSSFLIMLLIGSAILAGGWLLIRSEKPPQWLGWLLIGAALLRLALGAAWLITLPSFGHNTPAEKAGYIFADAEQRDRAAWKLAQEDIPLWLAVQNKRKVDQYGGMLFVSTFVYRYFGGTSHHPLLLVILSAAFSALAVLFTWGFSRQAWDKQTAGIAAWAIALYPEAALLGSSQMREAFIITLVIAAFYGLVRFRSTHENSKLVLLGTALLLCLFLSPPITALLALSLGITAVPLWKRSLQRGKTTPRWLYPAIALGVLMILAGLWLALKQFAPQGTNNPMDVLTWWIRKTSYLQAYTSKHASGWMQKIFKSTPAWTHTPALILYGSVQPFLPAALIAISKAPVWHAIAIWRAAGWALVLPFLLYAPYRAWKERKNDSGFTLTLSLILWAIILIASYRSGGDLWDNPRYRASFAGVQIAVAAWAFVAQRRTKDPVFRWALIVVISIVLWFIPWYLRRYTSFHWQIYNFFLTLGLGIGTAAVLIALDWLRIKK